jgi:hypothetical protein
MMAAAQHRDTHDLLTRRALTGFECLAVHKADDAIAQAGHLPDLLQDHPAHVPCADDQEPVSPQSSPAEHTTPHGQHGTSRRHQHDGQQPDINDHHPRKVHLQPAVLEENRGEGDGGDGADGGCGEDTIEPIQARHAALHIVQPREKVDTGNGDNLDSQHP